MKPKLLSLIFTLFTSIGIACAQPWVYTFGNSTPATTTYESNAVTPLSTTFVGLEVPSVNSQVKGAGNTDDYGLLKVINNTLIPNFSAGKGLELRGSTNNDVQFSVTDIQNAARGYFRFNFLHGDSTGNTSNNADFIGSYLDILIGNGNLFSSLSTYANNQIGLALRLTRGASSNSLQYLRAGIWQNLSIAESLLVDGKLHSLEVYWNNQNASTTYFRDGSKIIPANTAHLFIDHQFVGSINISNVASTGGPATNFQNDSYLLKTGGGKASFFIDDFEFNNSLPANTHQVLYSLKSGDIEQSLGLHPAMGAFASLPIGHFTSDAFKNTDLVIKESHQIEITKGRLRARNITIEENALLFSAESIANPDIIQLYGNIEVNGAFGAIGLNGIQLNIEDGNHTIFGLGQVDIARVVCSNLDAPNDNSRSITINVNTILNYADGASIANERENDNQFDITIEQGKTLKLKGNLAIDGIDGTDVFEKSGFVNINGTLLIEGKLFMHTNNEFNSNDITINQGGILHLKGQAETMPSNFGNFNFTIANEGTWIVENSTPFINVDGLAATPSTEFNNYLFNGGSVVEYRGNITQNIVPSSIFPYSNLVLSEGGTKTIANNLTTIAKMFILSGTTVNAGSGNLVFTLTSGLDIDNATFNLNNNTAGAKQLRLNSSTLNISNGGRLVTIGGGNHTVLIGRDLNITGSGSAITGSNLRVNISNNSNAQRIFTDRTTVSIPNLTCNKNSSNATFRTLSIQGGNVQIENNLTISNGLIATGSNKIILAANATISNEGSNRKVIGFVETTRLTAINTDQTFGGLGLSINCRGAAPNSFTVLRTTGSEALSADNSDALNQSILRNYTITGYSNAGSLDAVLKMSYFDDELNSIPEGNLIPIRSTNNGANWFKVEANSIDFTANTFTINGINEFSMWSFQNDANNPLPVSFAKVSATAKQLVNLISWSTHWEKNNSGFEVLKSTDGGKLFSSIGFVKGNGNTNTVSLYQFTDVQGGEALYKLKQLDFDGKFEFSPIVSVSNEGNKNLFTLQGNPLTEASSIVLHMEETQLQVVLKSINGAVLLNTSISSGTLEALVKKVLLAAPKGIYIMEVATEVGESEQIKVVR